MLAVVVFAAIAALSVACCDCTPATVLCNAPTLPDTAEIALVFVACWVFSAPMLVAFVVACAAAAVAVVCAAFAAVVALLAAASAAVASVWAFAAAVAFALMLDCCTL